MLYCEGGHDPASLAEVVEVGRERIARLMHPTVMDNDIT